MPEVLRHNRCRRPIRRSRIPKVAVSCLPGLLGQRLSPKLPRKRRATIEMGACQCTCAAQTSQRHPVRHVFASQLLKGFSMRSSLLVIVVWLVLGQAAFACPACKGKRHGVASAPAHATGRCCFAEGASAPCASCAEVALDVVMPVVPLVADCGFDPCGCDPCGGNACGGNGCGCDPYGTGCCVPRDWNEFYAELYRRYYAELERLDITPPNRRPPVGQR